jgi:hypothetical protein
MDTQDSQRYNEPEWELKLLEGENFKRFSQTIANLGRLLQDRKIPGVVVTLPQIPDAAYYELRFEPVRHLCETANVPFLDLAPPLRRWYSATLLRLLALDPLACLRPAGLLRINPANGHPSAALTHFYADNVADFLVANYKRLLDKGKQDPRLYTAINDCVPIFASRKQEGANFEINYPSAYFLLSMPVRQPFVQMNLEMPTSLKRISLSGPNLIKARIYLTNVDPDLHFDTGKLTALPEKSGRFADWELPSIVANESVNTICYSQPNTA